MQSGLRLLRADYGIDGVDVVEITPHAIRLGLNSAAQDHVDVDALVEALAHALDQLNDDLAGAR